MYIQVTLSQNRTVQLINIFAVFILDTIENIFVFIMVVNVMGNTPVLPNLYNYQLFSAIEITK